MRLARVLALCILACGKSFGFGPRRRNARKSTSAAGCREARRAHAAEFVLTAVAPPVATVGSEYLMQAAHGEKVQVTMPVRNIGDRAQGLAHPRRNCSTRTAGRTRSTSSRPPISTRASATNRSTRATSWTRPSCSTSPSASCLPRASCTIRRSLAVRRLRCGSRRHPLFRCSSIQFIRRSSGCGARKETMTNPKLSRCSSARPVRLDAFHRRRHPRRVRFVHHQGA